MIHRPDTDANERKETTVMQQSLTFDRAGLEAAAVEFFDEQVEKCTHIGIDTSTFSISHLAVRTATWREYVEARREIETYATANLENVWNGRPISKIVLKDPLRVTADRSIPLIELIPPYHQRVYRMGLEHLGFTVGAGFAEFVEEHREALTGQQFQSRFCMPVYKLFSDYTHVKFYERSLGDVCLLEGMTFEGFQHAEWTPGDPESGPYEL
ncbi:VOC family protein [Homoserinimonas sp. A447]